MDISYTFTFRRSASFVGTNVSIGNIYNLVLYIAYTVYIFLNELFKYNSIFSIRSSAVILQLSCSFFFFRIHLDRIHLAVWRVVSLYIRVSHDDISVTLRYVATMNMDAQDSRWQPIDYLTRNSMMAFLRDDT